LGISLIVLIGLLLTYDGYVYGSRHFSAPDETLPVQSGVASWYGIEEQGKLTANGERFDRHKYTAAHRRLPFNTMVRVTNKENGLSVDVRINDRGPYVRNRVLDLSEAAAKALDMKKSGLTPVSIEVLPPGTIQSPDATLP
jgi:rare lipoprotein A